MANITLTKPGAQDYVVDENYLGLQDLLNQGYSRPTQKSTTGVSNTPVNSLISELQNTSGYNTANASLATANTNLSNFKFQDLAEVYRKELERLGLPQVAENIAKLQTEYNKEQRVLEDIPDTILGNAKDVGINKATLDLRSSTESRPIIRNISDLLNSISVLNTQYKQGQESAQYATGLEQQTEANQYGRLSDILKSAQQDVANSSSLFGSLFPTLVSRLDPEASSQAYRTAESEIALRNAQIQDILNPKKTGSGSSVKAYEMYDEASNLKTKLDAGTISWGNAWNYLKNKYPSFSNAEIDNALGKSPAVESTTKSKTVNNSGWRTLFGRKLTTPSGQTTAEYNADVAKDVENNLNSLFSWLK